MRSLLVLVAALGAAAAAAGSNSEHHRMRRHASSILASIRHAGPAATGSAGVVGGGNGDSFEPSDGAKDSSDVTHLSRGMEERPERPPADRVFVIFKVNVRGQSVQEVTDNKRAYKAALASSLPEGDGVTGNDIAIELVALVEDVAGLTGQTRDVADMPAANEDDAAEEEDPEAEAADEEEAAALLELGTDPLPPNVRVRFRLVVDSTSAKSVVADLRSAVEGEDSEFQLALQSESINVRVEKVEEPQLITGLEPRDEEKDSVKTTSAASSLLGNLSVLPSFSLILALVAGIFLL